MAVVEWNEKCGFALRDLLYGQTRDLTFVRWFLLQVKKFLGDVSDKITPLAEKELKHLKDLKVS